jgi:putative membrane-bound dehydrogenase-like protein
MSSLSLFVALLVAAAPVEVPRVLDDRLQLELILQEPEIVTPTGLTIDARGRILVIESHTHFRPDGYQGPPHDRILLIDPTEKPCKPSVFFEGTKFTMNLAKAPDDSIYVATRSEIFRLRDLDGDDKADKPEERTPIAHLETTGNYPHNGLSGFAFGPFTGVPEIADHVEVYFGFGENLGADYKLIGSDGTSLAGGGEGGNIYACRFDGSKLRRVATGFWNPFHMTFAGAGQLFAVDNDPDSRPPCRLLHVVEGGDYGYRFRNGRKGTHPFTSWNGELPGTLPMVSGTGEAPCAVIGTSIFDDAANPHKSSFFDDLLVTSWGDHRLERYRLQSRGRSYTSQMEPIVVGGENFRPVGMAEAPDGSIFFSDWVDRSYPLHGKGRVWRLSKKPIDRNDGAIGLVRNRGGFTTLTLNGPESDAKRKAMVREQWSDAARLATDHFTWQIASQSLMQLLQEGPVLDRKAAAVLLTEWGTPGQPDATTWAAVAARDAHPENAKVLTPLLLGHDDPRVRLLGVIWAGEGAMLDERPAIEAGLSRPGLSRELFEASLAALEMIDAAAAKAEPAAKRDPKKEPSGEQYVLQMLRNGSTLPGVRRFALKALRPDHPELKVDLLQRLAADVDPALRIEAIRTIRERPQAERGAFLHERAMAGECPTAERLEALAGLSPDDPAERAALQQLSTSDDAELAKTARRILQPALPTESPLMLGQIPAGGDAAAGERLFFHPKIAGCYRCHEYEGRGAAIGPALTTFGRGADRTRILQSILEPSKEVAPHYVPWIIETTDGRTLTGLYTGEEVDGTHRYADNQGQVFKLHPREIESRSAAKQSIMPADFGRTLTAGELRDLAAFLQSRLPN